MMSAEEDVDIDLNLDEDAVQEEPDPHNNIIDNIESPDLESVSPPVTPVPVTPMSTQNLLRTEKNDVLACESADDDKINEADCLSSDSSVSGNSVVASPLLQKHASGLFDDQTEDFSIAAPNASIVDTTSPEVETLTSNLKATSIKSNDATSPLANTLFSSDKSNDDFLLTPDEKSPLQSLTQPYGLKTAQEGSNYASPFPAATPPIPGSNNYDSNTWKTPTPTNTPRYSSPLNSVTNQLHSPGAQQLHAPGAQQLHSPGAQPAAELRQPLSETPSSPYQNNIHSTPGHNQPASPATVHNFYNEKNPYESPVHYNPSNYPQTPVFSTPLFTPGQGNSHYTNPGGNSHMSPGVLNTQTPVISSNVTHTTPVIGADLQNTPVGGNLRNSLPYSSNIPKTTPTISANLQNTTPVNLQKAPQYGSNTTPVMGVQNTSNTSSLQNNLSYGSNPPYQTPTPGANLPNMSPMNSGNVMMSPPYGASIHSNAPPKKDDGPLFIPQMYCNSNTNTDPTSFFVPEQVSSSTFSPPSQFTPPPTHVNNDASPPTYEESVYPQANQYNISPLAYHGNESEKGILEWLKDRVIRDWPSGAQHLRQYMKTATDSVLTTLDPGMKDYLKSGMNIAVASQSMAMLIGIKDGFTDALHAVPVVQGHSMSITDTCLLPLGFERALQTTNDTLDYLSTVKFDLPGQYILMSAQIFLTELVAGEWYVMYCFGLKDHFKNICLHTFSQPIPLPVDCINASYNQMLQSEAGECIGYNIPIDEIVRRHIPYDKDWCSVLSGKSLHQIVAVAVQCLALDYQRHVDALSPPPSSYSTNVNYANGAAMNYHQNQPQNPCQNQPQGHPQSHNHSHNDHHGHSHNHPHNHSHSHPHNHPPPQSQYSLSLDAFG